MSYKLVKKLADLKPYDPIEGEFEIRLDANESYFSLDEKIKTEVFENLGKIDFNRYPDPYARDAVRAFADFYQVDEKFVTAGNGSDELISIISSCFLNSGDNLVTVSPDFSMYAFYASIYGLNSFVFEKKSDMTFSVDDFIFFCKEKNANMVIFSNPCNPTSCGVKKSDVKKILEELKNCLVVLDEAYMDFWEGQTLLGEVANYDNLIILKTCSKAIGLAGIRMGFAVSGEKITNALKAVKSPYNTDSLSQKIAETIFLHKELLEINTSEIIKNNKILLEKMNKFNEKYHIFDRIFPSKTNFIFIKTKNADVVFSELKKRSIAIRKFNGFLRISTGSGRENIILLEKLEEFVDKLEKEGE